jgi:hypothetical protein
VYQAQKKSGQSPRSRGGKTQRITKKVLETFGTEADPGENLSVEEAAWRCLLEKASPEEKARLNAMKPGERAELIRLSIEQLSDGGEGQE